MNLYNFNSPEANGLILSQLFQVRGNHEIWHKDAFRGGIVKLVRSRVKSDVRTISGRILFFVYMFASKDENVKFFNLQVYCMSYTNRKTTTRREE